MDAHEHDQNVQPPFVKFRVMSSKDDTEDILSCNKILDYIEHKSNNEDEPLWQCRHILSHQHTPAGHTDRNGSQHNVKMEWETGEIIHEPLNFLARVIAIDLARYADENQLLNQPRWQGF